MHITLNIDEEVFDLIVFMWACFFSLWVIYPIYFLLMRNEIVHSLYRLLLLLLSVLGFSLFIGKLSIVSSEITSLCISILNFLILSFHFFRIPLKTKFLSIFDLFIILCHLFLITFFLTDLMEFRLFELSDNQTSSLLGAFAAIAMLILVRLKK